MATQLEKQPLPKVKQAHVEFEDPHMHLWAVSYSDLLMVLLCFFIIYFEFSDVMEKTAVDQIKIAISGTGGPNEATEAKGPEKVHSIADGMPAKSIVSVEHLARDFKELGSGISANLKVDGDKKTLVVNFPDDIYAPGKFGLPQSAVEAITKIITAVKPFESQLTLSFIGHTDASPLMRSKVNGGIIDSNLVLSNLRGTKAVEFALQQGLDPSRIMAAGMGEHLRQTRSLSVEISEDRR